MLDDNKQVVYAGVVHIGKPDSVDVEMRKLMMLILGYEATHLVIGHNHPSGYGSPSFQDIQSNAALDSALAHMGVVLLDHIVLTDNNFYSFAENGHILGQQQRWGKLGPLTFRSEYTF